MRRAIFIMKHYKNLSLEDIEGEIWKDVVGYENIYMVSNFGRIKSNGREVFKPSSLNNTYRIKTSKKISSHCFTTTGYHQVGIMRKSHYVHRLVAIAFLDNPLNKETVNHIDGNKSNNNLNNLEWATRKENSIHAFTKGLNQKTWGGKGGTRHYRAKKVYQYDLDNNFIREYETLTTTKVYGFNMFCVANVCNEKMRYKTHKNYKWSYIKLH